MLSDKAPSVKGPEAISVSSSVLSCFTSSCITSILGLEFILSVIYLEKPSLSTAKEDPESTLLACAASIIKESRMRISSFKRPTPL